jgi:hypothetical protein
MRAVCPAHSINLDLITLPRDARFEAFTAMKIEVAVFWVVILCSDGVGYQRFTLKMEAS